MAIFYQWIATYNFQTNVHSIRNCQAFSNDNIHIVRYGIEAIGHKTYFLANLPVQSKFAATLSNLEAKIKGLNCNSCTCAQFLSTYSSCNSINI